MSDSITCPKCRTEIPLSAAISHRVEERLRFEFETVARAKEIEHAEALAAIGVEARAKLDATRVELEATTLVKARESVKIELGDLSLQLQDQQRRIAEADERELSLLKEKRELQEHRDALELEVARKIDEERGKLVADTTGRLDEEYRLKLREKDLTLEQMGKRIDQLRAAADQKRSGLQGEVLEREIEDVLTECFPTDSITAVKAGKRGADVVQKVRSPRRVECGTLLWESKNARQWSNPWVEKLKADQRNEGADIAIIVSTILPDGLQRIAYYDGVWICDFASATALATALRGALIEIGQARSVEANRTQALDALYAYLCSKEFQHRIASVVAAAVQMKSDLDAEKRAIGRLWAKREQQIGRVIDNGAGMYGELQAIVGDALQPVSELELPPRSKIEDGPLGLAAASLEEAA